MIFLLLFGNYGLDDISVSMVRKWQNQLIERGYSETYQKTLNNQLSALFNHAVAYYGLKNNPVRIAGPIGKEHGDEVEFYTKEEFDTFPNTLFQSADSAIFLPSTLKYHPVHNCQRTE